MSTAGETYSLLSSFCIDIGAIRARIAKVSDSTIFYTVSYTYTFFSVNSLAISGVCVLPNATQNQVAVRSCWFESGQGHQLERYRSRARPRPYRASSTSPYFNNHMTCRRAT